MPWPRRPGRHPACRRHRRRRPRPSRTARSARRAGAPRRASVAGRVAPPPAALSCPRPRPTSRGRPRRRRPRQVRLRRSGARGPARELGLPPVPDVVGSGRDHPHRADGVAEPRMCSVRQPLDPLPLRRQVRGGDHGEQRLRRAVPQHVLRDQRPRQCAGVLGSGARRRLEPDRRGSVQRQCDRELGDDRVRPEEAAQGQRRDRLEPVHRTGLRCDQCGGRPLRAGPRRSRPKSGSELRRSTPPGCEHRGPGGGIRMHVLPGSTLLRDDDADPAAGRCQVPQVIAPLLVHHRLPLTCASPPTADEQHPDRRQREHAAEQQRDHAGPARRIRPSPATSPRAAAGRGARAGRAARARVAVRRELAAGHPGDGARRPRHLDRGHRASVPAVRAPYTGRACDFCETAPRGTAARR